MLVLYSGADRQIAALRAEPHLLADCSATPPCAVLPAGWSRYFDEATGCDYYWNANRGESTWDAPPCPPPRPQRPPPRVDGPTPAPACEGAVLDVCGVCGGDGSACLEMVTSSPLPGPMPSTTPVTTAELSSTPSPPSSTPPPLFSSASARLLSTAVSSAQMQETSLAPTNSTSRSGTAAFVLTTPLPSPLPTDQLHPYLLCAVRLTGINFFKYRLDAALQAAMVSAFLAALRRAAVHSRYVGMRSGMTWGDFRCRIVPCTRNSTDDTPVSKDAPPDADANTAMQHSQRNCRRARVVRRPARHL